MQSIRFTNLTAVIAAVIALGVNAPDSAQMVTSSLPVPLAGAVFVPLTNGSLDSIALTGAAHVVTQVPVDPITPTDPGNEPPGINLPTIPGDLMNLGFDFQAVGLPPIQSFPPTR